MSNIGLKTIISEPLETSLATRFLDKRYVTDIRQIGKRPTYKPTEGQTDGKPEVGTVTECTQMGQTDGLSADKLIDKQTGRWTDIGANGLSCWLPSTLGCPNSCCCHPVKTGLSYKCNRTSSTCCRAQSMVGLAIGMLSAHGQLITRPEIILIISNQYMLVNHPVDI